MTTNSPSAISALTPWMTWRLFFRCRSDLTTLLRVIEAMLSMLFLNAWGAVMCSGKLFFGVDQALDEPFLHQHDDQAGGSMARMAVAMTTFHSVYASPRSGA
jgi:hypothetical protein